jgi:hypothetical protein
VGDQDRVRARPVKVGQGAKVLKNGEDNDEMSLRRSAETPLRWRPTDAKAFEDENEDEDD